MNPICQRFHLSADEFEWDFHNRWVDNSEPVMVCKRHKLLAPDWVYVEESEYAERNVEQLLTGQVA